MQNVGEWDVFWRTLRMIVDKLQFRFEGVWIKRDPPVSDANSEDTSSMTRRLMFLVLEVSSVVNQVDHLWLQYIYQLGHCTFTFPGHLPFVW